MMTMPTPRYKYYQENDADKIEANVLGYTNEVVNAIGFFTVSTGMELLVQVK